MEARDASGKLVDHNHVETITAGRIMMPGLLVGALISFAAVYAAPRVLFGIQALVLIVAASLVGAVCIASVGFALWGAFLGFNWHFTK